jgi:hypothetical protein
MTITLRNTTPAGERLKPAATESELRWFRKKRRVALARTVLVTGGMSALYVMGSLFRDEQYHGFAFPLIALGLIALTQVWLVVRVALTNDPVKDIQARRSAVYEEQRKRIFLAALDDGAPSE